MSGIVFVFEVIWFDSGIFRLLGQIKGSSVSCQIGGCVVLDKTSAVLYQTRPRLWCIRPDLVLWMLYQTRSESVLNYSRPGAVLYKARSRTALYHTRLSLPLFHARPVVVLIHARPKLCCTRSDLGLVLPWDCVISGHLWLCCIRSSRVYNSLKVGFEIAQMPHREDVH